MDARSISGCGQADLEVCDLMGISLFADRKANPQTS